jgi:hypothetical protein
LPDGGAAFDRLVRGRGLGEREALDERDEAPVGGGGQRLLLEVAQAAGRCAIRAPMAAEAVMPRAKRSPADSSVGRPEEKPKRMSRPPDRGAPGRRGRGRRRRRRGPP